MRAVLLVQLAVLAAITGHLVCAERGCQPGVDCSGPVRVSFPSLGCQGTPTYEEVFDYGTVLDKCVDSKIGPIKAKCDTKSLSLSTYATPQCTGYPVYAIEYATYTCTNNILEGTSFLHMCQSSDSYQPFVANPGVALAPLAPLGTMCESWNHCNQSLVYLRVFEDDACQKPMYAVSLFGADLKQNQCVSSYSDITLRNGYFTCGSHSFDAVSYAGSCGSAVAQRTVNVHSMCLPFEGFADGKSKMYACGP